MRSRQRLGWYRVRQRRDGVTAYLGIPYAAPPVGDLRWRPPQPAPHWEGTRTADHFGTSCMQNQPGSRLPWTEEFMTQGPIGEDCLYLNVWTAAKAANAKLPVMFWIYGGGFNEGSSSVAVLRRRGARKEGRPRGQRELPCRAARLSASIRS